MNTRQLFLTGAFLVSALFTNAQTVITTTSSITRVGVDSGTNGSGNAFYGYQAGASTNGANNTFIGHRSGFLNTNGTGNTLLGSLTTKAGSGNNNTILGFEAGANNLGNNNVLIGYRAASNNTFAGGMTDMLYVHSGTNGGNFPLIWGHFVNRLLKFNGKVGIGYGFGFPTWAGTVNVSDYNLFVHGGILTEEVRIMLKAQWADYVFEEDYNLPNLEEVEQFIKENKHLPNVPSSKEVSENGIELGEIATIQQEKIEELTLYVIEQNKINKEQAQQLEKQQSEIDKLKEQVKFLLEKSK